MFVRRSLVATVLAPVVLGLGLSGCQEAEPTPKMPETADASPTETPTETPTAEQESPEDFIRRWQAASDEMQVTGDTSAFLRLSPKCQPCREFAASVEDVFAAGGSVRFDGEQIKSIRRTASKPTTMKVTTLSPPTVITHGDTGKVDRFPGGVTTVEVILQAKANGWVVTHYSVL